MPKGKSLEATVTVNLRSGRTQGVAARKSAAYAIYNDLVAAWSTGMALQQSGDDFAWIVAATDVESIEINDILEEKP
jgi:hypothetical protein